jgi:dipeptidyl aminopeptidase/acylaminoacyl peptidase
MRRGSREGAFLVALLCSTAAVASRAAAQQTRPLSPEDAVNVRIFGEYSPVAFSPDGTWLAYVTREKIKRVDLEMVRGSGVVWNGIGAQISVSNVETGETRQLTAGTGNNSTPNWSPDGRYLAFVSDRDGSGQAKLWVWDTEKDQLRKISDTSIRADETEWTPDGRHLLVTTLPADVSPSEYAKIVVAGQDSLKPQEAKIPGSTVILYESRVSRPNESAPLTSDPWSLNEYRRDLAVIDVDTGRVHTIDHGHRITKHAISPDGSLVAFTVPKRFEKPGSQQVLFDLVTLNVSTLDERVAASDIRLYFEGASFSWAPDSRHLAFRTGGMEEKNRDCYVLEREGGTPRNITSLERRSGPFRPTPPLWDFRGEHIYFLNDGALWRASISDSKAVEVGRISERRITYLVSVSDRLLWTRDKCKSTIVVTHDDRGKQDGFYAIDLTNGRGAALLEKGQCYACALRHEFLSASRDGNKLAYLSEDAQHSSDLWMTDPGFRTPRRLTHLNPQFDQYELGRARSIDWLSDDGERLEGALLLPAGYEEGKRYPLVVWVYGGLSLSDSLLTFGLNGSGPFNMQLLATRGYAVLLPDAPLHLGTPMLDLVKTVLAGVNKTIEMGIADRERLAVMGHSNGGYSTLALIVQTKRFKAAIEVDGMGDLLGDYGQMNKAGSAFAISTLEHAQDAMGGTPWEFRDRYIENSPSFYLDRVETPLLIAHGSEDSTVPPFLADQVFVGLRRLGKEVAYAKYVGEDHSPPYWSHRNQLDLCGRMIEWLNLHLEMPAR